MCIELNDFSFLKEDKIILNEDLSIKDIDNLKR